MKTNLRRHKEPTHEANDCDECELKDGNKTKLKNHIKTTHEVNHTPSKRKRNFESDHELETPTKQLRRAQNNIVKTPSSKRKSDATNDYSVESPMKVIKLKIQPNKQNNTIHENNTKHENKTKRNNTTQQQHIKTKQQ